MKVIGNKKRYRLSRCTTPQKAVGALTRHTGVRYRNMYKPGYKNTANYGLQAVQPPFENCSTPQR